jgi:adenine-specific DNA-methyltransferase
MPTLDWLNREQAMRRAEGVPYRLLESVSSHGDAHACNLLIHGDNLDALKALLPFYRGRLKCIFIDPPYNTRSAFEHYDDNLEHSQWLSMMYPRLVLLRELLAENGSIWVSIDDNEGQYLKVLMDEVFGRRNFVANVVWEKSDSPRMDAEHFSSRHDYLVVFAKEIDSVEIRKLSTEGIAEHYDRIASDGRRYYTKPLRAMGGEDAREDRPSMYFPLSAPDGTQVWPRRKDGSEGRWRWSVERVQTEGDGLEWVKGRNGWTPYYRIYADTSEGRPPETIWPHTEVGSNRTSKAEIKKLFGDANSFDTPKPEHLIRRVLLIASAPGDTVLDSFLGSGTTAAVAHKMGRHYIGIESGGHATTHCLPRLQRVIEGENGGISEAVEWKGGGGFKLMRLGESVFDEFGAISPKVRFATLASFIWLQETGVPSEGKFNSPLLGVHDGKAYYLLYNGILGDKRPNGGNVLTGSVLQKIRELPKGDYPMVVYGESCRLGIERLREASLTFKHIPYDVRAR